VDVPFVATRIAAVRCDWMTLLLLVLEESLLTIPGVWEELLWCDPIVGASFLFFVAAIGMSEELLLLVAEVPLFLESSAVVVTLEELPCSRMEAGVLSSVGDGSIAVVDELFLDRRWFEEVRKHFSYL
jgi:hypothetical protein